MKRIINFILFGNIYIAIAAACLVQSTVTQIGILNFNYYYSILVFFATLFIYNLQRIFYKKGEDKSLNSIRRKWIFDNQITIKILTLIGFVGVAVTFFFNDYKIIIYLSPLLLLSLAYFIPFIKLRKSAWFKLCTLAIVWTIATAAVPILLILVPILIRDPLQYHYIVCGKLSLHIATRFCFMLAICIPFDIRDINIDTAENVTTLPHKLGEETTRNIALLFTSIYSILIVIEYFISIISLWSLIALLISMIATFVLILFSSSKRSEYYYVAGIDGTMILQGVLLMITAYFTSF